MSTTRLRTVSISTGVDRGLLLAVAVLAALMLAPSTSRALEVSVALPDSVTVGQTGLTATLTLRNDNPQTQSDASICNAGACKAGEGIILIPSCGSATPAPACSAADAGVFSFAAFAAIPVGSQCGASPLIRSFDVSVVDGALGKLRLVPVDAPRVILGPAGTPQATCVIHLTFGVARLPAIDAQPDVALAQTRQSASATAELGAIGASFEESDDGADVTTVVAATVVPPPPPVLPLPVPPPLPAPLAPPPPPPPPAPVDLDHFKCYEALQSNFRQRTVGLRDQFGQRRARVLRTRQICNPVSKNGGRVLQPRAHLTCYETRDQSAASPPRTVRVSNQFGRRRLSVLGANRLCVPSLKRRTAGPLPSTPNPSRLVDHFRCYDVRPQPAQRTVQLRDQFRTSTSRVLQVIRLCNPVRKNNEPVRRPRSHLVCYSMRDARQLNPIGVRVRNQFGLAALRVRQPQTLCLPSFKQVIATTASAPAPTGLDHFKCYLAQQPNLAPRPVGLRDQFGFTQSKVIATRQLCNPVRKNDGRVLHPRSHLVCYETSDAGIVPFAPRDVRVSNQFGIRQLKVIRPVSLCVPSLKRRGSGSVVSGSDPALVLDHFRCYDVQPQAAARIVKLTDQFKTSRPRVLRVVRLCNPVRKNNEAVRRPRAHLVCYSISDPPFAPLVVTVRNQFGRAALRVRTPQMLCLPSLKTIVTAAGDPA